MTSKSESNIQLLTSSAAAAASSASADDQKELIKVELSKLHTELSQRQTFNEAAEVKHQEDDADSALPPADKALWRDAMTGQREWDDETRSVHARMSDRDKIQAIQYAQRIQRRPIVLRGHDNVVSSVAFSPDGKRIVSCSDDGTVHIYSTHTDQKLFKIEGHDKKVNSVAFSHDGKRIVSGSHDKTVRVWSADTGEELLKIQGHDKQINSVAFSPDGKRFVSCSYDCTVRLWSTDTGDELLQIKGDYYLTSVAFSPDGKCIVSGSRGWTVRVSSVDTGEELLKIRGHGAVVTSVAFSPDGKRIVSGSHDKTVRVWSTDTAEELLKITGHENEVNSVAFSPDGKRIVSGSVDKTVRVWSADTGEELIKMEVHGNTVLNVSFSPNGNRIVSASSDHTVRMWPVGTDEELLKIKSKIEELKSKIEGLKSAWCDAMTGQREWDDETRWVRARMSDRDKIQAIQYAQRIQHRPIVLRGHDEGVSSVAFSPDGKRIVSGSQDKTVRVWRTDTGEELRKIQGHDKQINSVAFSPDGKRIVSGPKPYTGNFEPPRATMRVWSADTGEELLKMKGYGTGEGVASVAFSRDGKHIVSSSNTVRVWSADTGKELIKIEGHDSVVLSVAFSPDGKRIVSGSWDKTVRVWSVNTGEELFKFEGHDGRVTSVAFSRDSKRIVSGSADKTVRVWPVDTGEELLWIAGLNEYVKSVAFSSDGKRIVSGSNDKTVRVWSADTGKELFKIEGHDDKVWSVAFSPSGKRIVSGMGDNTVRVWSADTGEELLKIEGHDSSVWSVAFSPDGKRIVSGSNDKTVRVWSADTGEELLKMKGHGGPVMGVAFSPDGQRIVSGAEDTTVRIWHLRRELPTAAVVPYMQHAARGDSEQLSQSCVPGLYDLDRPVRGRDGRTLLHLLVEDNHHAFIRQCVAAGRSGAHLPVDDSNKTALDLAISMGHRECVELILFQVVTQQGVSGSMAVTRALSDLLRRFPDVAQEVIEKLAAPAPSLPAVQAGYGRHTFSAFDSRELVGSQFSSSVELWQQQFASSITEHSQDPDPDDSKNPASSALDSEDKSSAATALEVPLPGLCAAWRPTEDGTEEFPSTLPAQAKDGAIYRGTSFVHEITKRGMTNIIGCDAIGLVLKYKWDTFARRIFVRQMMRYLAFLLLFSVVTLFSGAQHPSCDGASGADSTRTDLFGGDAFERLVGDDLVQVMDVVLYAVLALWALVYLYYEVHQFRREGWHEYWGSLWNWLDATSYSLVVLLLPLRLSCAGSVLESSVASIAAVLLWFKVLEFMRGFSGTGRFVRILLRVMTGLREFMLVLSVVVLGFGAGFHLLYQTSSFQRGGDVETDLDDFEGGYAFIKVYAMLLGDFDLREFKQAPVPTLATLFFFVYTFVSAVVLMNLLISVLSDVYAAIQANVSSEWLLERSRIIKDIEDGMSEVELRNPIYFPMFLHVLQPTAYRVSKRVENEDLQLQVHDAEERARQQVEEVRQDVRQQVDDVRQDVRQQVGEVRQQVDQVRQQVGEVRENVRQEIKALNSRFDEIMALLQASHGVEEEKEAHD